MFEKLARDLVLMFIFIANPSLDIRLVIIFESSSGGGGGGGGGALLTIYLVAAPPNSTQAMPFHGSSQSFHKSANLQN